MKKYASIFEGNVDDIKGVGLIYPIVSLCTYGDIKQMTLIQKNVVSLHLTLN